MLSLVLLDMPESPQWLAMCECHADAHAVLVHTSENPIKADLRLEELKQAIKEPYVSDSDGGNV
jgi:hypothetical protein